MKIIKRGKLPQSPKAKRFTCEKCGCIFEATRNEYEAGGKIIHDWNSSYPTFKGYNYVPCPTCESKVEVLYENN